MKVQKKYLLLIAGFVWAVAGFNILKLGLEAYPPYISVINFILSLLVFGIFMKFVFYKMVQKHTNRIISYEEELQLFIRFFDIQAFCIMAFMMTMGISLRAFHLVPDIFIALYRVRCIFAVCRNIIFSSILSKYKGGKIDAGNSRNII